MNRILFEGQATANVSTMVLGTDESQACFACQYLLHLITFELLKIFAFKSAKYEF